MRLLLFLAFLVIPILEIWLLIQVGQVIGGPATIALLIADSLLGAWLVRREGRRAWRALQEAMQSGRMPDRELADGGIILVGGTLLLAPGFFLDVFGLLCLIPLTRPMMRRLGAWFFERRIKRLAQSSPYANLFPPGGFPGPDAAHYDPRDHARDEGRDPRAPQGGRVVHGEVIREDRDS